MATLVLGAVGTAVGGAIGGSFLGVTAATIGGAIGAAAGSYIDSWLISTTLPNQTIEGQRLNRLQVTTSTEGAVIPRVFGRMRMGGNIIWATDFREEINQRTEGSGKGGGPKVTTTTYAYYASFAIALCEGIITGIGRIWADGELMDLQGVTWRWYAGDETQEPDPFIKAKMGEAPAYRGAAYLVFEELLLESYGNRIPQVTVEVFRPLLEGTPEGRLQSVTLVPASGEYVYATRQVTKTEGGARTIGINVNAEATQADLVGALDRLQASAPNIQSISLVVAWFGDDLRCGSCKIRPSVDQPTKNASTSWSVNGVCRSNAFLVSRDDKGDPIFGGTPADFSVVEAIREIKARGLRVTFYPFILMDIPPDNTLPNPYSDDASDIGQPAYPWRGRLTCSPAPDFTGSPDKGEAATGQVSALFGSASIGDFSVSGANVSWTGPPNDWGLRRMILHYAQLCKAAGDVDAFLIGSEMRGLNQVRGSANNFPATDQWTGLLSDVRSALRNATRLSYAADWSEYFGFRPQDDSGGLFFHLDPLWAHEACDFVGIDNYMPLSDWRDGFDHLDAQAHPHIYDQSYLKGNIAGGEGFDWFYASDATRIAQVRTPITDGAHNKPWVFRYKDLQGWWGNQHFDRPGGVEEAEPTAWVPQSKPIWFTEFGCPAVDRATNQPNVFIDPKSSESKAPYFSRAWRDDAIQRAYLDATLSYWQEPGSNPTSSIYGEPMLDLGNCSAWTWDARPYPFFPELTNVWSDGENWRLGHWLGGRLGAVGLGALVKHLCKRAGLDPELIDTSDLYGAVEGYVISALQSPRASIAVLARHFGFDAVESEGILHFKMRGRGAIKQLGLDDLVAAPKDAEPIEFERAQETELPQALKWSVARADEDYDAIQVEAQRVTVQASRVSSENFPLAVAPEEAERRVRRALQEAWVGREGASFALPPSELALDPTDVVALNHDGRSYDLRLLSVNDGVERKLTSVRQDRQIYDMPPGPSRKRADGALSQAVVFGKPLFAFLDLPQLSDSTPAHQPLMAAYADPWPGALNVYRSQQDAGFKRIARITTPAQFGVTLEPFKRGPTSRFDLANELIISVSSGTIESIPDLELFTGDNAFAIETAQDIWEIIQASKAELIALSTYKLSRLLRGQRGTESAIGDSIPAGARVIRLDDNLVPTPIALSEISLPFQWRIVPGRAAMSDPASLALGFTPEANGLKPFSPIHVAQPNRKGRLPGDLTISWVRRSRVLEADSWLPRDVPLGEHSEAYEMEIFKEGSVIRTLTSATASMVYIRAEQIEDFGAELTIGATIAIRIYQLSNTLGRGTPLTTTLHF
ncbi:glycoside hydrolase TIM-barrel-like domain-containing protein [Pseudovibrio sp. Tun.PSC04-5.I4]|uniref:baseplate multidomain protein megatron n=1 Tax=Pseudovibrio sp. Tun.PSC04-5.I4 TaxID=1798213 RepID=UPI00088885C7|nr:glycoside hydrolase TIM-barrel-like domain-containing protein [Pseudovibrio sp. Tun.PSC04-5.I4]SDR39823.1 Putative phage tail protein [Pseudovibrio sp. Tun.PSC04-5.I4]